MAERHIDIVLKARDEASAKMKKAGTATAFFSKHLFALKVAALATATVMAKRLVGAVSSFITEMSDAGDLFEKTQRSIGLTTEMLSGLSFAAEISGSTFSRIRIGLKTFGQVAFDASKGVKTYVDVFDDLGVSVMDNTGKLKETDTLLLEVADAFQGLEHSTIRLALASRIFGRSGLDLLPLLTEGRKEIAKLSAEARELGLIWSQEDAVAAAEFQDAVLRLKGALRGIGKEIVVELFPILNKTLDQMKEWAIIAREDVAKAILKILKELEGLGPLLKDLASIFKDLTPAMTFFAKVMATTVNIAVKQASKEVGILTDMWRGFLDVTGIDPIIITTLEEDTAKKRRLTFSNLLRDALERIDRLDEEARELAGRPPISPPTFRFEPNPLERWMRLSREEIEANAPELDPLRPPPYTGRIGVFVDQFQDFEEQRQREELKSIQDQLAAAREQLAETLRRPEAVRLPGGQLRRGETGQTFAFRARRMNEQAKLQRERNVKLTKQITLLEINNKLLTDIKGGGMFVVQGIQ